jgi:hypothetical protein
MQRQKDEGKKPKTKKLRRKRASQSTGIVHLFRARLAGAVEARIRGMNYPGEEVRLWYGEMDPAGN